MMKRDINDFWVWLQISFDFSAEKYALSGVDQSLNQFEDCYPHYDDMLNCCFEAINQSDFTDDEICDILTVMAFDNEAESVLEYLEVKLSESDLHRFIRLGLCHRLFEARWQLAELIFRRKPNNHQEYLEILAKDNSEYVRWRAKNALNSIKMGKTGDGSVS